MISFNYETDFTLSNESHYEEWISHVIASEGFDEGEINYIFCNDVYLHKIKVDYLDHNTLTDIISFDYTEGKNPDVSRGTIRIIKQKFFKMFHVEHNINITDVFKSI